VSEQDESKLISGSYADIKIDEVQANSQSWNESDAYLRKRRIN